MAAQAETDRKLRESSAAIARGASERADIERKITEVDDARQQIGKALEESETAVRILEHRIGEVTQDAEKEAGEQRIELARLRDSLESARQETVQLRAKSDAGAEDFRMRLAALEAQTGAERDALARVLAGAESESRQIAIARDEALAKAEAERAHHAQELADALAKAEAERARLAQELTAELGNRTAEIESARSAIAALEREKAEAKAAHEVAARQRDEFARRIARITGEQKRLLEDLADTQAPEGGQPSVRPSSKPAKTHIVEMSNADILPPQRDRVINLPPARPAPIAPPKVRTI